MAKPRLAPAPDGLAQDLSGQPGRAPIPVGTAIVMQDDQIVGPLDVETLSAGRVSLQGASACELLPGKAAVILSIADVGTLRLPGEVLRQEWQQGRCRRAILDLKALHADLEDDIQEAIIRHLERSRMPMVVALDDGGLDALKLKRSLHDLGRDVVFADDADDARRRLESLRDLCGTILVDHSFLRAHGAKVLATLHDQYPDKRRLLVLPKLEASRSDVRAMIWSVHGVLTSPWTREQLECALGLFPAVRPARSKRILFVDDEPAVLSGLQHRLRKYLADVETVWVTSAEVALSESKARPFDVVVADLRMPGMDGLSLLRAIREQAPQSKRIALTGGDTEAAAEIADAVLRKPCPIEVLRSQILGGA